MKNNESTVRLTPVATQRASEAIYAQIADMITSGQLKPGDRLPSERAMMEMLGRSRPTIREALRMLERNGLIQIIAGSSGALVAQPGTQSVEEPLGIMLNMNMITGAELLEYRELNEVAAAGWAAERRTEEDLAAIRHVLEQTIADPADFKSFSVLDIAFHQAVANATHNRAASMVCKVMHQTIVRVLDQAYEKKSQRLRRTMLSQIRESHQQIYDAIAAGDARAARETMHRHMRMFENDVRME